MCMVSVNCGWPQVALFVPFRDWGPVRRLPGGLRASVGSAVELRDGTDSNERTSNRSWFPILNCPSTICAGPRVAGSTPARSAYDYPCPAWSTSRTGHQGSSAPHPWGGSPDVLENGESGSGLRGSFRGAGTPTCRTFSTNGGFDVQGMLHLRLPASGLLRLPVRRVQESQGQAPLARPQSIHLESPSARTCPCAGEGSAMRLPR